MWDFERQKDDYAEAMPSTLSTIDAYMYWSCFMARHGLIGRCVHKRTLFNTEYKNAATKVATSMASMSIMFDRDSVQRVGNYWSSKSMQIMTVLASLAVQSLR